VSDLRQSWASLLTDAPRRVCMLGSRARTGCAIDSFGKGNGCQSGRFPTERGVWRDWNGCRWYALPAWCMVFA